MSSKYWKTEAFKKLNSKWQKKVQKAGHDEIEDLSNGKEQLLRWHNHRFKETHIDAFTAKQEYFSKCRAFMHEHAFESKRHADVWALHSEGYSFREIAAIKKLKIGKDTACDIVIKYRKIMLCK